MKQSVPQVGFVSLGCPKALVDSERILTQLRAEGYEISSSYDGADLVVETSHIAASTITNNGLDHSDDLRMVERYRIDADNGRLVATQWFSDPTMIANNGARWIEWELREGEYVYPYECDPSFALEYSAQP